MNSPYSFVNAPQLVQGSKGTGFGSSVKSIRAYSNDMINYDSQL